MKKRLLVPVTVLILLTLALAACSAAVPTKNEGSQALTDRAYSPSQDAAKGAAPAGETAPGASTSPSQQEAFPDRRVIYTATISIFVSDVLKAMEDISTLAQMQGGLVAASNLSNQGEKQVGSVTIKVPAKSYTETMSKLRRLASKVKDERADSKDVTEEFTDLEAQVRNLEAVEEQYQGFMKKANTIDEVLKVQQKLTEVRGQIERLKGRMGYLERQSDMATITASLLPETVEKPQDTAWRPLKVAQEAWESSLRVLEVLATIVITVGVFSLWAVPLLAPAAYLMRVFLRRRPAPAIDSQPGQG